MYLLGVSVQNKLTVLVLIFFSKVLANHRRNYFFQRLCVYFFPVQLMF